MRGPVLVTGATGMQGGAVARTLLRAGFNVRGLTRNLKSSAARGLTAVGAELVEGDLDDGDSLDRALAGAYGVFSVQLPPPADDENREIRTGDNLVRAAVAAGVNVFVHSSVARAGDEQQFRGWDEGQWWKGYWTSKSAVNEAVKSAGIAHWIILKPAFYMENFLPPRAQSMFPKLRLGRIESAMPSGAKLDFLSTQDIAEFALAAFANPQGLHGLEIPIASQSLSMTEVAAIISDVTGRSVAARHMSYEAAIECGVAEGVAQNQVWAGAEGYQVDIEQVRSYGIPLDTFEAWARRNAEHFSFASTVS